MRGKSRGFWHVLLVFVSLGQASVCLAVDLVPYTASGWRYLQVAHADPLGQVFMEPSFDDSGWSEGQAGFGAPGFPCPLDGTIHTSWAPNTEMFLRRRFAADLAQPVTVHLAIDNDAKVYVNGTLVLDVVHEGCASLDNFSATVPSGALVLEGNVLAVRAIDRGAVSYVDLRIEGTAPAAKAELVQTACETLAGPPPGVRITSALINLGGVGLCAFRLAPRASVPFGSCPILDCAAPTGWSCSIDASTGTCTWSASQDFCLQPLEIARGFQVTIGPSYCCYDGEFLNAAGEVVISQNICFLCDTPVATDPVTWTRVRSLYR